VDARFGKAALALLGTLAILAFVPGTLLQAILFLIVWALLFWPLARHEWILVLVACLGFTAADISVTGNGVFTFSSKDVLGLPYFEPLMWGFFYLHAARLFPAKLPRALWPGIVLALLVSAASALPGEAVVLTSLSVVLLGALMCFHTRTDLIYAGYFTVLGIVVESVGTRLGLWSYHIAHPLLWWVLTWSLSGLILYRAALPVSAYLARRRA